MISFADFNREWVLSFQDQVEKVLDAGVISAHKRFIRQDGAYKMKLLPLPLGVEQSCFDQLVSAGQQIIDAQSVILKDMLKRGSQKQVLDYFRFPQSMKPYVDWDALLDNTNQIARFDIIPTEQGFKFCEFNYGSPVGGTEEFYLYADYLKGLGLSVPAGEAGPRVKMAQMIADNVDKNGIENVVLLVMEEHIFLGYFSMELFKTHIQARLPYINVTIANENDYPSELLKAEKGQKTLVYRVFVAEDIDKHQSFFKSLWASGCTIINTLESEIRMNKKWLAMFHDPQYQALLNESQLQAIQTYVPYTCEVTETNKALFVEEKDKYVFKCDNAYAGKGVLIGNEVSTDELNLQLQATNSFEWVVQEVLHCEQLLLPKQIGDEALPSCSVLGLYFVDGQGCGLNIRASHAQKIVNVSGDAQAGWVFPMTSQLQNEILTQLRAN